MEKHFEKLQNDIIDIRGTLRLHNWMLGTILAFIVAVFFKVFSR